MKYIFDSAGYYTPVSLIDGFYCWNINYSPGPFPHTLFYGAIPTPKDKSADFTATFLFGGGYGTATYHITVI